jgi:hypothetical protein
VTKLVIIGDDEYYGRELAGRKPLNRTYLAKLVKTPCDARARVIALDVDLRVLDPTTDAINDEYKIETGDLIKAAVSAAADGCQIVLAKTIYKRLDGLYELDPDSYDSYGLCADLDRRGTWKRKEANSIQTTPQAYASIHCGYILLNINDRRLIPGSLQLKEGGSVESFALAAARAQAAELVPKEGVYFGSFIPKENFDVDTYTATQVLTNTKIKEPNGGPSTVRGQLGGKIVIVAGKWHQFAYSRGPLVDMHETPLDQMFGGLIHANFIESLLQHSSALAVLPEWSLSLVEVLLALVAAATLVLIPSFWMRWLLLGVISLVLLLIQFVTVNVLGIFFDGGVVLFGVWLHSMIEWVVEHATMVKNDQTATKVKNDQTATMVKNDQTASE